MKISKISTYSTKTTRSLLLTQCDEAAKNIRLFKKWVEINPWLDQTTVDLSMPWFPFVCLGSGSKSLVVAEMGEDGWQVAMSGEIRKTAQGVTVAVAG